MCGVINRNGKSTPFCRDMGFSNGMVLRNLKLAYGDVCFQHNKIIFMKLYPQGIPIVSMAWS
jgi:hypothetical protein